MSKNHLAKLMADVSVEEACIISNEYAFIAPHHRERGLYGYLIAPAHEHAHLLTNDEMAILLSIYTRMLQDNEKENNQND